MEEEECLRKVVEEGEGGDDSTQMMNRCVLDFDVF